MQWVEWVAVILSAVSVYLSAREKIWAWPLAIVGVSLYAVVFVRAGLYSGALLQLFFLAISIYGWYSWLHGGEHRSRLHVSKATRRWWAASLAFAAAFWLALGFATSKVPGVSLPALDSGLTTLSIVAQVMLSRKILENWILWIVADVIYVPMYLYKGLYPTAGLYAVFLLLATFGLLEWRRSYARDRRTLVSEPA